MNSRRAVVWGAAGGIGRALVDALASSGRYSTIYAGSRVPLGPQRDTVRAFSFDLFDEASIASGASTVTADGPVELVIVATGTLHNHRHQPEKSFAALTAEAMIEVFHVNTIGPALIAKHMIQGLPRDRRSVFAALTARVGSIGDNRLGGWHSYRASKAALNMIISNLAVELSRSRPHTIVVGLHPGTVDTSLSRPFQKAVADGKLFSPAVCAQHLLTVIDGLTEHASGAVLAWDGQRIAP